MPLSNKFFATRTHSFKSFKILISYVFNKIMSDNSKGVATIKSLDELKALGSAEQTVALNFAAEWCEPCAQMNDVFSTLSRRHKTTRFVTIDVDAAEEALLEQYDVTAVPTYLLLAPDLTLRARVDGADAARLTAMLDNNASAAGAGAVEAMAARLEALTTQAPVMLFMKGSPDEPQVLCVLRRVLFLTLYFAPYFRFRLLYL